MDGTYAERPLCAAGVTFSAAVTLCATVTMRLSRRHQRIWKVRGRPCHASESTSCYSESQNSSLCVDLWMNTQDCMTKVVWSTDISVDRQVEFQTKTNFSVDIDHGCARCRLRFALKDPVLQTANGWRFDPLNHESTFPRRRTMACQSHAQLFNHQ